MVHEIKNFHSEVLTDGGALMREEERQEAKQRKQEQQEREVIAQEAREAKDAQSALQREREESRRAQVARQEAKRLALEETAKRQAEEYALKEQAAAKRIADQAAAKAARIKADEENRQAAKEAKSRQLARDLEIQKENQEATRSTMRKSSMHALLDDLGDKPSAVQVGVFDRGVANVPGHIPEALSALLNMESDILSGSDSKIDSSAVRNLNAMLPSPSQTVNAILLESEPLHESGEECIARVLDSDEAEEEIGEIRSKRGKERVQRLLQEKRTLEAQVSELQAKLDHLQGTLEQDEEEPTPAIKKAADDKQQAALVTEAKLEMLRFLNSRESEVDHLEKVNCFYRYMTNPFYMHTFVQNNRPDEWQGVMEYIYDAIEKPVPPKAKRSNSASTQPIRSRTSTLGAPLVHASKPIERITEHLSNMGI
jgi:hypothetical protein